MDDNASVKECPTCDCMSWTRLESGVMVLSERCKEAAIYRLDRDGNDEEHFACKGCAHVLKQTGCEADWAFIPLQDDLMVGWSAPVGAVPS